MAGQPWVFFDVDHTMLRGGSFARIIGTGLLRAPWRSLLLLGLWPLLLAPALTRDWRIPKSLLLWMVTVGRGRRGAVEFLRSTLLTDPALLWRPEAAAAVEHWRRLGVRVCYVSASAEIWLRPLLRQHDEGSWCVIGSRLRFFLGGIVIAGRDCRGREKVRRIEAALGPRANWICAYGDSLADVPMLACARRRILVNPPPRRLAAARRALGHCEAVVWSSPGTSSCAGEARAGPRESSL